MTSVLLLFNTVKRIELEIGTEEITYHKYENIV